MAQGRGLGDVELAGQQAGVGGGAGLGAAGRDHNRGRGPDVGANVAGVSADVVDNVLAAVQIEIGGLGAGIAAGEDHVGVGIAVHRDLVPVVAVLVHADCRHLHAGEGVVLIAVAESVDPAFGVVVLIDEVQVHQIKSGQDRVLAAQLNAATLAVDDHIVAAFRSLSRRCHILFYRLTGQVAESGDRFFLLGNAGPQTHIGFCARFRTGGRRCVLLFLGPDVIDPLVDVQLAILAIDVVDHIAVAVFIQRIVPGIPYKLQLFGLVAGLIAAVLAVMEEDTVI